MKFEREDSPHGILIYALKPEIHRGRVMHVNDVTIRIENANGSHNDLTVIADKIMAAFADLDGGAA